MVVLHPPMLAGARSLAGIQKRSEPGQRGREANYSSPDLPLRPEDYCENTGASQEPPHAPATYHQLASYFALSQRFVLPREQSAQKESGADVSRYPLWPLSTQRPGLLAEQIDQAKSRPRLHPRRGIFGWQQKRQSSIPEAMPRFRDLC